MSLIPILFSDDFDLWRHGDYKFGMGLHPHELRELYMLPNRIMSSFSFPTGYHRPWTLSSRLEKLNFPDVSIGKDGFQVLLDVQQFAPNEVSVKTIDNEVVVEGKHEERPDPHGYISRHFIRKYTLPNGYDPNAVVSTISSDGVLTIKAPLPAIVPSGTNERVIEIQQTGPAHLSVKGDDNKGKVTD